MNPSNPKNPKATTLLPTDVILEILLWLPVKSLLRFKCVNKEWFNLISGPFFINLHLQRGVQPALAFDCASGLYLFDDLNSPHPQPTKLDWLPIDNRKYDNITLVGSCNGLLCFCNYALYDISLYICNPSTHTFEEFSIAKEKMPKPSSFLTGFGYDMTNDDYKVVFIHDHGKEMFVYSMKTDSWRRPPQEKYPRNYFGQRIVSLNNRLHWIIPGDNGIQIAVFDLCSEEWDTLLFSTDPLVAPNRYSIMDTGLSHGCLCVTSENNLTIDIWIMKEYGIEASWNKLVSITKSIHTLSLDGWLLPIFISYSKSGCKVLFRRSRHKVAFLWYDVEQKTFTESDLPPIQFLYYCNTAVCAQSLVSITRSFKEKQKR